MNACLKLSLALILGFTLHQGSAQDLRTGEEYSETRSAYGDKKKSGDFCPLAKEGVHKGEFTLEEGDYLITISTVRN